MDDYELFDLVTRIDDAGRRRAKMDEICPHGEQRRRLERLLAALEQAGEFLEFPAADLRDRLPTQQWDEWIAALDRLTKSSEDGFSEGSNRAS